MSSEMWLGLNHFTSVIVLGFRSSNGAATVCMQDVMAPKRRFSTLERTVGATHLPSCCVFVSSFRPSSTQLTRIHWSRHFVSTFHTPSYSTWAKRDEMCLQNVLTKYFSTFQNLRLEAINLLQKIIASQKNQHIQPSATRPVLDKPAFSRTSLKFGTTNCG